MDPERLKKRVWNPKIFSSNILQNILTVSYNSIIIAVINLIFHLVMIRKLGPEDYGLLETLLTINSMVLIAVSAVGFVVARFVSYYRTRQQFDNMKFLANWAFIFFFLIGMAAFLINIILSRVLSGYLRVSDSEILVLFGVIVWVSFLMPIIDGILRGLQEFKYLGRYKLIDSLLRMIIASIIVFIGLGVKSVILTMVIVSLITLLSTAYLIKKVYINKPHRIKLSKIYLFTIPVFMTMICLATLSNIDLILVKHFFDDKTTGFYAAAGILAKIVFSLALGSSGVLFPKVVELYSNGEEEEMVKNLHNTINIVLIPGVIITAVIALFPKVITKLFFGTQYDIGALLSIYSISLFFLAISVIFMMYDLAIQRFSHIPILMIAAIVLIHQISISHQTLYNIVWTLFVINASILVLFLFYNRREMMLYFNKVI